MSSDPVSFSIYFSGVWPVSFTEGVAFSPGRYRERDMVYSVDFSEAEAYTPFHLMKKHDL